MDRLEFLSKRRDLAKRVLNSFRAYRDIGYDESAYESFKVSHSKIEEEAKALEAEYRGVEIDSSRVISTE